MSSSKRRPPQATAEPAAGPPVGDGAQRADAASEELPRDSAAPDSDEAAVAWLLWDEAGNELRRLHSGADGEELRDPPEGPPSPSLSARRKRAAELRVQREQSDEVLKRLNSIPWEALTTPMSSRSGLWEGTLGQLADALVPFCGKPIGAGERRMTWSVLPWDADGALARIEAREAGSEYRIRLRVLWAPHAGLEAFLGRLCGALAADGLLLDGDNSRDASVNSDQTCAAPTAGPPVEEAPLASGPATAPTPRQQLVRWEDLNLRFINGTTIRVTVAGQRWENLTPSLLGCEDKQTRDAQPTEAWWVLRLLGENRGILRVGERTDRLKRPLDKTHVTRLRKVLRKHFDLDGDPLPPNDDGYRAAFTIAPEQ